MGTIESTVNTGLNGMSVRVFRYANTSARPVDSSDEPSTNMSVLTETSSRKGSV
jgi:hypothetical protein